MIRHQIRAFTSVLSKPALLYSTSVTPKARKKTNSALIQKLLDEFTDAKDIIMKLTQYEQTNMNFNEWKNRIDILKKYHFTDLECFYMISGYPSLLEIPLHKFEQNVQQWQLADLGLDSFKDLLLNQPVLVDVDVADIRKRVPQLRALFGSSKVLAVVLNTSPNVMFDNWQAVMTKIDYLVNDRRLTPGTISQCSALSQSLDFIKFRFDLLEKCGVYKKSRVPIHKLNKYDKSGHVNPSLKDIMTENVEKFVKVANISNEEYEVCRDLYMSNEDDDFDSDSESED